ncbi:hypothetical protein JX266_012671 [Neoarthrinium moseri]|nr:hypothetical protein JX266_012671 [Neoarthrinium moseri]
MDDLSVDFGSLLHDSDNFSDVTVKCQDEQGRTMQEWRLHRAVLASRSPFFRKALTDKSTTASQTSSIVITGQEPRDLGWVFEWIYTGVFAPDALNDEQGIYMACLDMAHCADYLMMDRLIDEAMRCLQENLANKSIFAQRKRISCTSQYDQVDEGDLLGLFVAIRYIFKACIDSDRTNHYATFAQQAKTAFCNFVADTHYWILPDRNFQMLCQDVPEFHYLVLQDFAAASAAGKVWVANWDTACSWCEKLIFGVRPSFCARLGQHDNKLYAACPDCSESFDDDPDLQLEKEELCGLFRGMEMRRRGKTKQSTSEVDPLVAGGGVVQGPG